METKKITDLEKQDCQICSEITNIKALISFRTDILEKHRKKIKELDEFNLPDMVQELIIKYNLFYEIRKNISNHVKTICNKMQLIDCNIIDRLCTMCQNGLNKFIINCYEDDDSYYISYKNHDPINSEEKDERVRHFKLSEIKSIVDLVEYGEPIEAFKKYNIPLPDQYINEDLNLVDPTQLIYDIFCQPITN